jgi:hypothetical protein
MKVLAASAVLALLAGATLPAYAQQDQERELTGPEEMAQKRKEEADAVERAYQRTMKNTQSGAVSTKADPWGNIRGNDTPSKSPK